MLHWLRRALAALLASLSVMPAAAEVQQRPLKREILALYDGAQEGNADATRIHRFAELPLNHLGYVVRYRDVRVGLPEPREVARFAGVITWFVGPLADSDSYLAWAVLAAEEGPRFIVLGDLGAIVSSRNLHLANRVMSLFGLRHTGDYVSPADGSRVIRRDGNRYEFECRLDPVLPDYPVVETISPEAMVDLQLTVPPHLGAQLASPVSIGRGGGFASFNYEFCHQHAPLHRGKWLINPFSFFRAALGARVSPIPDVTTLSGRRIYFSLVYSEGWSAPSETEIGSPALQIAAEIVARELIEPFPELAVTLDLRESDMSKRGGEPVQSRTLAERLLRLPQVTRPGKNAIGSRVARFDATYDSISNLAPLATAGAPRVILTATSNELAYEADGFGLSADLFSLRETLSRTELPRRLKPANINFNMRVGREHAAVSILRGHLRAARSATLVPISASLYADIAQGYFSAEIAEIGDGVWRVSSRGQMQTVRFDDIGSGTVDMRASRGVLGYSRHGAALYVALDEAVDAAVIGLTDKPAALSGIADAELSDSRWRLRKLVRESSRIAFEAQGYGPGEFNWRLPAGTACQVTARRDSAVLWSDTAVTDENGHLMFTVPVAAVVPMTIEIDACRSRGKA